MGDTSQTIRIFISSPGDVAEERDGARRVIEGLQRHYPKATLQPVLWEELALPATASFQESIDFLLEREPIDIAVFILWSRLGSPLGASITRPDGTAYRSGTEREFDLMLSAFEQSGRKRPVILAYVRDDDAAFRERLTACPTAQLEELIEQRKLSEVFVTEQFHDADGRNLRAYQTYSEPIGFVQRLRVHLKRALDDLLQVDSVVTWTEEPYRGLETFDIQHAPIFYGREEETCDLLQRLRDQEQAGSSFVVIVGASGSGKSSLARAGVAANLVQHESEERALWRVSSFIPALAGQSLFHALVRSLANALPELIDSEATVDRIAKGLAENSRLTVELTIAPAFSRSVPSVRLLIILDQMEELWTDRNTTAEDRESFLGAIESLTCSGHVAVLATLRSDFYHHAQASPAFLRLKGERGHYDLLPPDSASIHRLITEPARRSGLRFEQNEKTDRSLDEVILEDASHDPNALPLLEFTLSELYQQRDEERRLLTYAAYVELGGVEGAIGKRAEETFASLPAEAQAALDEILPLLVSVDVGGELAAVRRRASVAELTSTPARKTLTERLIAARFLTTDRQDDKPIASLAHEALLRRWGRIVNWINTNREQLRLRARVEQTQQRWEQQDRDDSLLLAEGVPLDDGRKLLREAPYLLTDVTKEYIDASVTHHEHKAKRSRRTRTAVLSTIAALLVVMIVGGIAMRRINAREKRSVAAKGLTQQLLTAETSDVPATVDALSDYADLIRDDLDRAYEESEEDSKAKLHAALALLAEDDSVLPYLQEQLLLASPKQVAAIALLLEPHKEELLADLWPRLEGPRPEQDGQLLHVASAVAMYDSENAEKWNAVASSVTEKLVTENPLRLAVWLDMLRNVDHYLMPSLGEVFRASPDDRPQSEIDLATGLLEAFAADDLDQLSELLLDADPKQFVVLFDELAAHGEKAIERMNGELARRSEPDADRESKDELAHCQSRAATALLRMGQTHPVLAMMQRDLENPEALTQFVHRCRESGVKPTELLKCLDQAAVAAKARKASSVESRARLDRAMYGMLLALGEFKLTEIPQTERQRITDQLVDWYASHPSSAVHGATGWLLRSWGFEEAVSSVDRTPLPFDESYERDWYVLEINPAPGEPKTGFAGLLGGTAIDQSDPIYFTMIVFPPGEFIMGSPEYEQSRDSDETLHQVRLTLPLAVSDREITWAQFSPFDQSGHQDAWEQQFGKSLTAGDPVFGVSWFDSVAYCRWLTTQDSMAEADQWYSAEPLSTDTDSRAGWVGLPDSTEWPVNRKGQGYRLLTDAEWEHVCRSGTRSAFSFGNDRELLDQYGWFQDNSKEWSHTVAQLRPNPRGLFDLHGNVYEWCHDWSGGNIDGNIVEEDPVGLDSVSNRVIRGGCWYLPARFCRSSGRGRDEPTLRSGFLGFRVAAVPFVPVKPGAERDSEQTPQE